jgi:hypothetical protein
MYTLGYAVTGTTPTAPVTLTAACGADVFVTDIYKPGAYPLPRTTASRSPIPSTSSAPPASATPSASATQGSAPPGSPSPSSPQAPLSSSSASEGAGAGAGAVGASPSG